MAKIAVEKKKCFSSIPRLENRKDTKPVGDRNTKWTNCMWRKKNIYDDETHFKWASYSTKL